MSRSASASPPPRVFVAHPLCPPNLRAIVEDAVEAFDSDLTATGLQVLTVRDTLTGLAKARFDNQLFKTNKALLEFAGQVAQDDLLPTRLPDKVKKPKWAKPRKPPGKASGRSFTGAEAAEMAADKAEKSSKMPDRRPTREDSPENSDGEVIVPATPLRPAQLAGESQGG